MVAWASTNRSPGSLSSGSTSVRSRATPSRLDSSTVACPSRTAQRWAPRSTKCPPASQRSRSATSPRSGPWKRSPLSVSISSASPRTVAASAAESLATCRASATTIGSSRTASASARRSTDLASWMWIQDSSMVSGPDSPASTRTSSRVSSTSRRTRTAGCISAT